MIAESAHLSATRGADPVEAIRGSFARHRFVPHFHAALVVGIVDAGAVRARFTANGHTADVVYRAGDIFVIDPGRVHTGEAVGAEGWSYRALHIPMRVVCESGAAGAAEIPQFAPRPIRDAELRVRIAIAHAAVSERHGDFTPLVAALRDLVGRHADGRAESDGVPECIELAAVRTFLEHNFASKISVRQLTALSGIPVFTLVRRFRRAYGLPPHALLGLIRVERARQLLRDGVPASDVAYRTGFCDQSHLNRRFKRILGIAPVQYARAYESPEG